MNRHAAAGFTGPRVELHCHLDGSVRPETIDELARRQGLELGGPARQVAVAPSDCRDFRRYLAFIDPALQVLQTKEALTRAARELVEDWVVDDVVHGEVRFAPQLHTRRGLAMDEVVLAVEEGLRQGRARRDITTGLLLCCLRTDNPGLSMDVARVAVQRACATGHGDPSHGVAGLDLSGDELTATGAAHAAAFDLARAADLPITVHAGEMRGPESIREALDVLGARRIGHGTRLLVDPAAVDRVVTAGVIIESCPWLNQQTASGPLLGQHPLPAMLDAGVLAAVSTDARTVSDLTLRKQEALLVESLGWDPRRHRQVQHNGALGAFLPAAARDALARRTATSWSSTRRSDHSGERR